MNGVTSSCVNTPSPPTSSLINACGDLSLVPSESLAICSGVTTLADSAASQSAQTYTMNVINLPAGGANVRVYKTTANGSNFWGNSVALTLGSNSITVTVVSFDRSS